MNFGIIIKAFFDFRKLVVFMKSKLSISKFNNIVICNFINYIENHICVCDKCLRSCVFKGVSCGTWLLWYFWLVVSVYVDWADFNPYDERSIIQLKQFGSHTCLGVGQVL